jgi:hypothetical protein
MVPLFFFDERHHQCFRWFSCFLRFAKISIDEVDRCFVLLMVLMLSKKSNNAIDYRMVLRFLRFAKSQIDGGDRCFALVMVLMLSSTIASHSVHVFLDS